METWHPRATDARANKLGVQFLGYPTKIVLHTTESSSPYSYDPSSYYGNPYWPHATIDQVGIHQHLPIDVGGYALYHESTPTNAANAIQCEIVWRAANSPDMPDALLANIADWIGWVAEQTGAPLDFADFVPYPASYGEFASQRFSNAEWLDFTGVCGHEHVPSGNDHGDPGAIPVAKLQSLLGSPPGDDFMSALSDSQQVEMYHGVIFTGQVLNEWKSVIKQGGNGDYSAGLRKLVKLLQEADDA